MAFITTAYINNGTLLAQANKVAVSARLAATAASGLVTLDLNTTGTIGTYNSIVTDAYGRITSGTLNAYLTGNQSITVSGDATGSGTTAIALTLASVFTAGTYTKIITNAKGLVVGSSALASSDITTALGFAPVSSSLLGANSGVATLDSTGHLTVAQIPASLVGGLVYQGTWNATTNTPTLASGTGTNGQFYKVATAGTTTLDGIAIWNVGDSAVFEIPSGGTVGTWAKIDGITNEVISVAGMTGVVTLTVANVTGAAPLASPAFTGTPTNTGTLSLSDNSSTLATTSYVKGQNYITGNQTVTLSGDATGSGTTAITVTLASVGTAGAYTAVTTDAKGRVISGSNLTVTGDVTGTASGASVALTLATVAAAGTYQSVVVNTKGLVTSGGAITSANVTGALGYTPANIASPTFTGIPAAATAAYATNTTQIATTAFVERAQGNYNSTIFVAGATNTLVATQTGALVEATGTIATAVSVVAATGIPGQTFSIWNNSTASTTLTSLGGNFSGPNGSGSTTLVIPAGAALDITSDGTLWAASGVSYANDGGPWLNLTGGTLTGALVGVGASFTTLTASSTVSGAGFTSLLAPYAPLASPALTGVPTAPTATYGTNSTQLATTAFVLAAQGNSNPTIIISGTGNTLSATQTGSLVEATGTVAIGASVVSAVGISGQSFGFYNNSTQTWTNTSLGGNFTGPSGTGTTTLVVPAGSEVGIKSDGTNWIVNGFAYTNNLGPWLNLAGGTVTGSVAFSTVTAPTLTLTDNSTNVATTAFVKGQSYLTGNQTITVSGDATGSGTTAIALTLAASGVSAGTYSSVIVNSKGLVTGGGAFSSPWSRVAQTTATGTIANSVTTYVGVNFAGAVTLTLATGSTEGRILYIKDESGNAYTNNITVNSSDTIDGATFTILNVNYEGISLVFSGSAWRQM